MAKTYRGVSFHRLIRKYSSAVSHKGIKYNCGTHDTAEAAAKARDRKIIEKGLNVPLQILKPLKRT